LPTLHSVVIGAGIVGAATALELLRDGHRVTILDPGDPGGEQAASYGNGAWLSTASVVPVSVPGLWRKVPVWLRDPLGPLAIRPAYLPKLLPWLVRFLHAGATVARVEATARALRPLIADAPERHRRLAEAAGVGDLIERRGLLYVYRDRRQFEAEAFAWRLRAENGVRWLELSEDELRQREPELDRAYTFGVMVEDGGHCTDPGGYVAALIRHARALGAVLRRERATGFRIEAGRLRAVRTENGEFRCDRSVICAGAYSGALARAAGDRVPLETERGYNVSIADPGTGPRHPIMPGDMHTATTMTRHGLRIAGQVEFAGLEAAPDWRRADILRDYARRAWPGLPPDLPPERIRYWMGRRPSTPDGLPCIGPASATGDIVHAYGHGHIGLAAGALTGRLAADLVSGKPPVIDAAPYAPQRFRRVRVR
jgi:D-amino-acid dehydrogenase